jgi:hypothetical protein
VLELSVNNPRRVCAACGEVNLPSEHSGGHQGAAGLPRTIGSQWRGLVEHSRNERVLFWVTAVPTAVGIPVFFQIGLRMVFARSSSRLQELVALALLSLLVLLTTAVGPAIALAKRRKMSVAPAVIFGTLGFLAGGFLGPWLVMPLHYLLAVLS